MYYQSSVTLFSVLLSLSVLSNAQSSLVSNASPQSPGQAGLFSSSLLRRGQVQTVLEHLPVSETECRQSTMGPIETTACDYESVDSVTDDMYDNLHELVQTPFFKFFRLDLYRECPFWQENVFCMNQECGIATVDESEIPEKWRASTLGKVETSSNNTLHALPGCYYRDSDFCWLDDLTEGDYIDLTLNPERFTGYAGTSAARVWRSIYEENCFGQSEINMLSGKAPAPVSLPDSMSQVMREDGAPGECLEKRVYYKIISGLHASISTHICHEMLDKETGEWVPDLQCFISRVAAFPERLQYIYFDAVLMLRAVARIAPYLSSYDYCSTGTHEDDAQTLAKMGRVVDIASRVGRFDETVLFRGANAQVLKEEFKEHFRNVTRLMDCVGCDKCRLWGKVQTTGIATAMKILFEIDENALDPKTNPNLLQRSEVVALINTLHRLFESLHAVRGFRKMWANTDKEVSEKLLRHAEKVADAAGKTQHDTKVTELPHIPVSSPLEQLLARLMAIIDAPRRVIVQLLASFEVKRGQLHENSEL